MSRFFGKKYRLMECIILLSAPATPSRYNSVTFSHRQAVIAPLEKVQFSQCTELLLGSTIRAYRPRKTGGTSSKNGRNVRENRAERPRRTCKRTDRPYTGRSLPDCTCPTVKYFNIDLPALSLQLRYCHWTWSQIL